MKNPKSYLKFKHYKEFHKIQKDHSDITVEDFYRMCRQMSNAIFGETNTKEYFGKL
jgi:hypothetical protein